MKKSDGEIIDDRSYVSGNYACEMQGYFYSTFTTFRNACENSSFFLFLQIC